MDIKGILARIDERLDALNLSARALSLNAGLSADGIRNWKRRAEDGQAGAGMNMSSLTKIAKALQVSQSWLLTGSEDPSNGFADEAASFVPNHSNDRDPIRALYASMAHNPAITHCARADFPDLSISAGDLIVCDIARAPEVGEAVIAVILNEEIGTSTTIIRRFMPPLLTNGTGLKSTILNIDPETVIVRYPIIGIIRGPNSTSRK